jgi:hypothetical protein
MEEGEEYLIALVTPSDPGSFIVLSSVERLPR